jgi:hypothetical protein
MKQLGTPGALTKKSLTLKNIERKEHQMGTTLLVGSLQNNCQMKGTLNHGKTWVNVFPWQP